MKLNQLVKMLNHSSINHFFFFILLWIPQMKMPNCWLLSQRHCYALQQIRRKHREIRRAHTSNQPASKQESNHLIKSSTSLQFNSIYKIYCLESDGSVRLREVIKTCLLISIRFLFHLFVCLLSLCVCFGCCCCWLTVFPCILPSRKPIKFGFNSIKAYLKSSKQDRTPISMEF